VEPKRSMAFYIYPDHRASCFTRRKEIHSEIKDSFRKAFEKSSESAVVVLLGMGGSGKTQLAIDFCKRGEAKGRYEAILWVDATNPKTLAQSYAEIAKTIYGTE
jgi:hypothetical protein